MIAYHRIGGCKALVQSRAMMIKKSDIAALVGEQRVYDDAFIEIVSDVDKHVETRLEALITLVKGKRVLHVGCCDHIEIIEEKRKKGIWLHDLLCAASAFCAGIDIDAASVDYVRKLGFPDVYCADVTQGLPRPLAQGQFDVVVVGEVVEHVDAPVSFLRGIREAISSPHMVVVSVPNAFFLENFENAICGIERINTDHRFWFTPYTIGKVLSQAGYSVQDVRFVFRGAPDGYRCGSEARKRLMESSPALRDVLLAIASSHAVTTFAADEIDVSPPERIMQYENHDIGRLAADDARVKALEKWAEDVERDRDRAYAEKDAAWRACDLANAERDRAYVEKDAAWRACDLANAERDRACVEKDAAWKAHDRVEQERNEVWVRLDAERERQKTIVKERDEARQALALIEQKYAAQSLELEKIQATLVYKVSHFFRSLWHRR